MVCHSSGSSEICQPGRPWCLKLEIPVINGCKFYGLFLAKIPGGGTAQEKDAFYTRHKAFCRKAAKKRLFLERREKKTRKFVEGWMKKRVAKKLAKKKKCWDGQSLWKSSCDCFIRNVLQQIFSYIDGYEFHIWKEILKLVNDLLYERYNNNIDSLIDCIMMF